MFNERVHARADQRDRTQSRILEAAHSLFASHGYAATTIRAIAQQAGVSAGRVIAVGDKETLLVRSMEMRLQGIHDARTVDGVRRVADAPAEDDGGEDPADAAAAIVGLVRPFVEVYTSDPEIAREFGAILARGRTRSIVFDQLAERLEDELAAVFRASGAADTERLARTAYLVFVGVLYATSHGAIEFEQIEGELMTAMRGLAGDAMFDGAAKLNNQKQEGQ